MTRSILITGASSGIGRHLALSLAEDGHKVFASVRSAKDGAALRADSSGKVETVSLDVTDEREIERAAAAIALALDGRGLDVLINNAGVVVTGALEELPPSALRYQLEVNVVAVAAVTHAFLPLLRRGGGRIINMGSVSGRVTMPFMGPYSASKMGLVAISRALRMELRPWGIPVTLLEVGNIRTPLWTKSADGVNALRASQRYSPFAEQVEALSWKMERGASEPATVERAVRRVLGARRPAATVRVGLDAKMWHWIERLLPAAAIEALACRALGLHAGAIAIPTLQPGAAETSNESLRRNEHMTSPERGDIGTIEHGKIRAAVVHQVRR